MVKKQGQMLLHMDIVEERKELEILLINDQDVYFLIILASCSKSE